MSLYIVGSLPKRTSWLGLLVAGDETLDELARDWERITATNGARSLAARAFSSYVSHSTCARSQTATRSDGIWARLAWRPRSSRCERR